MRWSNMWYLESKYHDHKNTLTLMMVVTSENFAEFLTEKLKPYPIYLVLEHSWFRIGFPYSIHLETIPDLLGEVEPLTINKELKIMLPDLSPKKLDKIISQIEQSLLTWIEGEYDLYQQEWKQSADY